MKRLSRNQIENFRLQGIAAALGELAGYHMEPDLAVMVLNFSAFPLPTSKQQEPTASTWSRLKTYENPPPSDQ
jgi:hypothetical protein